MKKFYLIAASLFCYVLCSAQKPGTDWVKMMQDPSVNYHDVQKAFNTYYTEKKAEMLNTKEAIEEGEDAGEVPGFSLYKRWEWFMRTRIYQDGSRPSPSYLWEEMQRYYQNYPINKMAGSWTPLGPSNTSGMSGAGRVNALRVDPNSTSTLYACTPAGGLWKSTNGGTTWSVLTDKAATVIGCTDIAIDPTNSNHLYLATGDGDAFDNNSVGLLQSTDGGVTWSTTGLSFGQASYIVISRVLLDPTNTQVIMCATTSGIYRSTNGGTTFTKVQAGSFKSMEFNTSSTATVYACGTQFYRSTDNGATWTQVGTGLPPVANVGRMALAVTPANNQIIYLIAGAPAPNYGVTGVYESTNGGTSWTTKTSPSNFGNQEWYDLAIAVNPTNSAEVLLGGQTTFWKSTNSCGSYSQIATTTHVDYHSALYTSATEIYVTSDGGVYHSTNDGSTWTNLNNNLSIAELYGFGQSTNTNALLITGNQDNGTNKYTGTWAATMGGDGMLCFISRANDNNMWGSQYNGSLNRSTNGGASWSTANNGITETGAWVTPWRENAQTANNLIAGFVNMWKSTNGGQSWTQMGTLTGTETIQAVAQCAANGNYLWCAKGGTLYKSTDGGNTWTAITGLPGGQVSYIACHNTNTSKVWVTYGGYTNTLKVYQTTDGGTTWTSLSATLPNIPINCVTYINGSNDGLYIGTDVGVFYKDATMNVWQPFSTGLPNVIVTQIENFTTGNKLRCSTYGRGMWESPYYTPGNYAPVANFTANKLNACPGAAIQFTDWSAFTPTSWSWTFTGGIPSTSTAQNPLVYYNTPGNYPVTLTVSNINGSDTKTVTSYINIASSSYSAPTTTGGQVCSPGGIVNLSASPSSPGTLRWWNQQGGGSVVNTGPTYNPNITSTTTWYVDRNFPNGGNASVGPLTNSMGTGAMFTANDIRGLYFDVINPIKLNSVDIYVNSDGNRTIEIIDPQGNTYWDTTQFMFQNPTTPVTYPLGVTLYPGTNYFIKFRGTVDCYRNNSGAVYPYPSASVNITNSNAGSPGYYYFFYNWQYTNIVCNTSRTPVTGTVIVCTGEGELFADGQFSVYPNPNNGNFDVWFNSPNRDNYLIKITNTLGQVVYEEKVSNFSGTFLKQLNLQGNARGIYMLTISNGTNKSVKKLMVY